MRIKTKIWIEKNDKLVFGEGRARILKAIQKYQSINKAAESMDISFRHAWSYINESEKRMGVKLVERTKGGVGGGGSTLTDYALRLMDKYDRLKHEIDTYADQKMKEIFNKWKK